MILPPMVWRWGGRGLKGLPRLRLKHLQEVIARSLKDQLARLDFNATLAHKSDIPAVGRNGRLVP